MSNRIKILATLSFILTFLAVHAPSNASNRPTEGFWGGFSDDTPAAVPYDQYGPSDFYGSQPEEDDQDTARNRTGNGGNKQRSYDVDDFGFGRNNFAGDSAEEANTNRKPTAPIRNQKTFVKAENGISSFKKGPDAIKKSNQAPVSSGAVPARKSSMKQLSTIIQERNAARVGTYAGIAANAARQNTAGKPAGNLPPKSSLKKQPDDIGFDSWASSKGSANDNARLGKGSKPSKSKYVGFAEEVEDIDDDENPYTNYEDDPFDNFVTPKATSLKSKFSKAASRPQNEDDEEYDPLDDLIASTQPAGKSKPSANQQLDEYEDLEGDSFINDGDPYEGTDTPKGNKSKAASKPQDEEGYDPLDDLISSTKPIATSKPSTFPKASAKRQREKPATSAVTAPQAQPSHHVKSDYKLQVVHMTDDFRDKAVAFIDYETTSFSARIGGRAVSLGILMMVNGVERLRWEAIFNPDKDSNVGAFKAHHISRSVTRQCPRFEDVAEEISGILMRADKIVAHNAPFDYRYMKAEFERAVIINALKRKKFEGLLSPASQIHPKNKAFLTTQLALINEMPSLKEKRLYMLQSRISTAIWLYIYESKLLLEGGLFNETTGHFDVPFIPTPESMGKPNVKGYAKAVNSALLEIYNKMLKIQGRNQRETQNIGWNKFENVDISSNDDFTESEKKRKATFDKQIRAVSIIKKFTFLEIDWNKIFNWERVSKGSSVFYNKSDRALLSLITGYLNLARDLVETGLYRHQDGNPRFLDYQATWECTYALAKQVLHKGQDISGFKLDALCDFFGVNRDSRKDGHGALIDSDLLAKVYAHLRGSQLKEIPANDNIPMARPSAKKRAKAPAEDEEDDEGFAEPMDIVAKSTADKYDDDDLIGGIF